MKVQIVKCKTCGEVIAACKEGRQSADWYKDLSKLMKTENVIIETIEPTGNIFGDMPLNKCCGKKVKP